jgi:hypothetical protein
VTKYYPLAPLVTLVEPFDAIDMFISWQDIKMGLLFKLFFTK